MKFLIRDQPPRQTWTLTQAGVHPLLARLYAGRGIRDAADLDDRLQQLLPPDALKGAEAAARLLADAIETRKRLCVVADYDCDGATACAVALRGLRLLGAQDLDYLVPNRVVDGYGLSAPIAERVAAAGAEVLVTVDNGIASHAGVARARQLGLQVLVTDHHLPAATLPLADAIVNPNQPDCGFGSKALAGVGVMFYTLLALRAELRSRGHFDALNQPRLARLLPLVALGTVADVVPMDANNRRLVSQGLDRIRRGHMPPGLQALFEVAGRQWQTASTQDFGFALGPRLNAAGRLSDMTVGIELLLTDDAARARALAQLLDDINQQRREIESEMRDQALAIAERLFGKNSQPPAAIAVQDESFHEGVVGIVASRLKDLWYRPSFVFAPSGAPGKADELKGSGRSIAGFHLRDALDLLAKRQPGILLRFGGHAMAAGCTIERGQFDTFKAAFEEIAGEWLEPSLLKRELLTDGPLELEYCRLDVADMLREAVWGQGFAAPLFSQRLEILSQRIVGQGHLSLKLKYAGQNMDGIWFGRSDPLDASAHLAYQLAVNEWQGRRRLQFIIREQAQA